MYVVIHASIIKNVIDHVTIYLICVVSLMKITIKINGHDKSISNFVIAFLKHFLLGFKKGQLVNGYVVEYEVQCED